MIDFIAQNEQLFMILRTVVVAYGIALIIAIMGRIALQGLLRANRIAPRNKGGSIQRVQTLQGLVASAMTFVAFVAATLVTLSILIDTQTIIWIFGLFSAAFGLGAQTFVRDIMHGVGFIFRNTFDVGEKVEFFMPNVTVEGVIEEVDLRNTTLRSWAGESWIVPNGEIRVVRNFTRAKHSNASITLFVETHDLPTALGVLEPLGVTAVQTFPNLLEPWEVITTTSQMGRRTELTLIARAKYGTAAVLRPKLLTLVQEHLTAADVDLVD